MNAQNAGSGHIIPNIGVVTFEGVFITSLK
jgi:hypothetical protein